MNLDQLEVLRSVVEKGSFRQASETLHKSQPALSVAIKNLEEEFGVAIFDRSNYRPTLTKAGSTLYKMALEVLEKAAGMKRAAHELGIEKIEPELRVSVDPLIDPKFIEVMSEECARPTSPVKLILNKSILSGGINDLREGMADLAFGPCDGRALGIEFIEIQQVKLVTVVSRKLLQENKEASRELLTLHPQILVFDRSPDEASGSLLPQVDEIPGQKIYVHDHTLKRSLILNGLGWGRLGTHEFTKDDEVVKVPTRLCVENTLKMSVMRAKDRPLGPIGRRIWERLQNTPPAKNRAI